MFLITLYKIVKMDDVAITVRALTKRFDTSVALDGLEFTVENGTNTALLGANGAGKTTTLAILLGLLLPSSGEVFCLGEDILKHRYRVLSQMNFSSPYVDLPQRLSVRENLTIYARLYGVKDYRQRIKTLARELELEEFMTRQYRTLSAGQKTRVSIAKALINQPQLLLLDEPTASLDPDSADRLRTMLSHYQQQSGATILMASHNMVEVERMCSKVLMMRAGKIVDHGTPEKLIKRHGRVNLEEVFLDIARSKQT